ncbi:hypothetical protein Ancab_005492 [Ancistrocladus abbreviatus]
MTLKKRGRPPKAKVSQAPSLSPVVKESRTQETMASPGYVNGSGVESNPEPMKGPAKNPKSRWAVNTSSVLDQEGVDDGNLAELGTDEQFTQNERGSGVGEPILVY